MIFITSEKEMHNSIGIYKKIPIDDIIFFQKPLIPESHLIGYLEDLYLKTKDKNKEFVIFSYDGIIFDIIRVLIKWKMIDDPENKIIYYVSDSQIYEGTIRNNGTYENISGQLRNMFNTSDNILMNLIQ